jgi:hypothetical protein
MGTDDVTMLPVGLRREDAPMSELLTLLPWAFGLVAAAAALTQFK